MTTVEQIAEQDPELFIDEDEDASDLLDRAAFQRIGRAVVTGEGAYVGIVSITDVQRSLRARRLQAEVV